MSFRVLATAAHFDDAELGCGGTLAKHVKDGDQVWLYVATRSNYRNMQEKEVRSAETALSEGRKAAKILGVRLIEGLFETFRVAYTDELVCAVRRLIEEKKIDTVYLPHADDVHQDHRAVARASITAARHCPRILMYRINYYDSEIAFEPRHYVDISKTMPVKINALKAHASEMRRTGGKWLEHVKAQDRCHGIKLGVRHAEGFQAVRYLAP